MSIKTRIIESLLNIESLSTSQLSENCGYSAKDIDHIHTQLSELESEGYFVVKTRRKTQSCRGRRPKIYKIKQDMDTISRIFQNFPELEENIRNVEWILEKIIENRISIDDPEMINEVKNMLRKSPQFFQLFLEHTNISKTIEQWNEINNVLLPDGDDERRNNFDGNSINYIKLLDFFAYCIFSDALNRQLSQDSLNYLQDLRERLRDYHQNVTQHFQNYASMNAMMYSLTTIHKILSNEVVVDEKMVWLKWLTEEINKFELLRARIEVVGGKDAQLEEDMKQTYENIIKNFENYNNSNDSSIF
jgi:hypothetical protein